MTVPREFAPIELFVGVSGHRDLREQDVGALEAAVDRLFADLSGRFPNTPIALVSQLAEGADRLVARVAGRRGIKVIGLLPMPRHLYETDFTADASKKEFETMLQTAANVVELPLPAGMSEQEAAPDGDARNSCYAGGGVEVNRTVHLLIALWDGQPAVGQGGTGEIVQFMLNGPSTELREVDDFLHFSRVGPVVHIWTPRRRGTGAEKPAGQTRWLAPQGPQWKNPQKEFERQIEPIEQFNADAAQRDASGAASERDNSLLPASARCSAAETPEAKRIEGFYRIADRLAGDYQSRARRVFIATVLAGLVVLSFYELNVHYHTHRPLFMALFVICMAISAGLFFLVWKPRTHERFLDYRALAEALRVQYFWSLAGTGQKVIEHLVPRLREELETLRLALLGCADGSGVVADGSEAIDALRCVQRYWVRDQKAYFQKRAGTRQTQVEWNSAYKAGLVAAGAMQFVMVLALSGSHAGPGALAVTWTQQIIAVVLLLIMVAGVFTAVIGIKRLRLKRDNEALMPARGVFYGAFVVTGLLALLGSSITLFRSDPPVKSAGFLGAATLFILCNVAAYVLELYGEHFAFKQHVRRYRTMADLFARADGALAPLLERPDVSEARRLIVELGRESLAENAEWLAMHRERPIRLVRPG